MKRPMDSQPRSRAAPLWLAALFVWPLANCECSEDIGEIPEPQIDVRDEEGALHTEADPWLVVDFGDVDDGARASRDLRVLSAGRAMLRIESVCLVAAASAEEARGNAPCILAADAPFTFPNILGDHRPGDEIPFPIEFVPAQGGPVSLFVRIASTAALEPVVAFEVRGRGTSGRLCADNPVLDFGAVSIGATATQQITLTNCGVRPVSVDSFAWVQNPDDVFGLRLEGALPEAPVGPLLENESLVLEVSFTPAEVRSYRDALAGNYRLTTAAPYAAEYNLLLLGDGREPPACRVNVVPETLQFGAVASGTSATQQLILQSVGECACEITSIEGPLPEGSAFTLPAPPTLPIVLRGTQGCEGDPAGAQDQPNLFLLDVAYAAPERSVPAVDRATLELTTTDAREPARVVSLEANGGGTPYCQFEVTPQGGGPLGGLFPIAGRYGVVEFGRTTVYFTKKLPITLKNVGNTNCEIEGVQWDSAANTLANEFGLEFEDGTPVNVGAVAPISVPPGQSQRFFATFSPTRVVEGNSFFPSFGNYSASTELCTSVFGGTPTTRCNGVRFLTSDTATEDEEGVVGGDFSIGFSATPVEPAIDVIPGELDFGLVTLGCGSPERELTLYNTGSGDLSVGEPYATPDTNPPTFTVAAQAPSFPYTVPPGGRMRIRVRYYARTLGLTTGELIIPTFEGNQQGPPVSIPLRGEGTLETEQTDIFDQFSDPKVDVLWVVDDSGSMESFQTRLAGNFPQFFNASNVDDADYHIAVTTTLTAGGGCIPNPLTGTTCEDHPKSGFYTACEGNDRFLTPQSASPSSQFQCNVRVSNANNVNPDRPISDSAEGGLGAAKNFLEPPNIDDPAINGGFLRDDAKLHVIIVSDEPDQSSGPIDLYVDFFRNLKGFRNDSLVAVSAIAGPRNGCTSSSGGATVQVPGDARYPDVVDAMNGRFESICTDDWTGLMTNLGLDSLGLKVEYFLSRAADSSTLEVCVRNGGPGDSNCRPVAQAAEGAADGYFYDPNSNSIVFNPAAVPPRGARVEVHYETYCY